MNALAWVPIGVARATVVAGAVKANALLVVPTIWVIVTRNPNALGLVAIGATITASQVPAAARHVLHLGGLIATPVRLVTVPGGMQVTQAIAVALPVTPVGDSAETVHVTAVKHPTPVPMTVAARAALTPSTGTATTSRTVPAQAEAGAAVIVQLVALHVIPRTGGIVTQRQIALVQAVTGAVPLAASGAVVTRVPRVPSQSTGTVMTSPRAPVSGERGAVRVAETRGATMVLAQPVVLPI